jgi:hypothetical protein
MWRDMNRLTIGSAVIGKLLASAYFRYLTRPNYPYQTTRQVWSIFWSTRIWAI